MNADGEREITCHRGRANCPLSAETHAFIEADMKRRAARAHLIPDHVWLRISEIWNSPRFDKIPEEPQ